MGSWWRTGTEQSMFAILLACLDTNNNIIIVVLWIFLAIFKYTDCDFLFSC